MYITRSGIRRAKRGRAAGHVPTPPTQTFSAANSTVSASPTTVASGVSSTITVTVRDTNGNPIQGYTVVLASTGSTNTLGQPSAATDANGVATGTLSSTTLETKTVSATANSNAITQTASVVVQASSGAWLTEDFSTYTSTADILSDPRGIYSVGEDVNTAQMALDPSVGYTAGGLTKSLRFDYPARNGVCTDYTIGRNINLPTNVDEVWVEVVAKFQNGFTTIMTGCSSSNPDFKFLFGRVQTSGRFNIMIGTSSNLQYTVGYPGGEDNFEGGSASGNFDGNWHIHRWHMKVGASGACKYWVDGVVVKDYGTVAMATNQIYGLAIGRNINQGPPSAQSLWWGRILFYNTDPGW